jgi:F-type H+-transporting ATPase subunit epsilon
MAFSMSLVAPDKLLFSEQVDQVDLPGVEGDFGVLAGHAPIVALLRPGIVTSWAGQSSERFVVLGGLAEFSSEHLTILAEQAASTVDFDLAEFKTKIEEIQQGLTQMSVGAELDQAVALLDHYKLLHTTLSTATAF